MPIVPQQQLYLGVNNKGELNGYEDNNLRNILSAMKQKITKEHAPLRLNILGLAAFSSQSHLGALDRFQHALLDPVLSRVFL